MGAIFTRHAVYLHLDDYSIEFLELHRSTGEHPYPAGEYHIAVWGLWLQDSPIWTRSCVWDEERDDGYGRRAGCDLEDHTFTNPKETS